MIVHRVFAPLKKLLPGFIARPMRGLATGLLTPLYFSRRTGHFRSSVRSKAVDQSGRPIPWYTYSCFDFLRDKDFTGRHVLEFGSGQSTLWWARRAESVLTFEANEEWYAYVRTLMPDNVAIHHIPFDLEGMEAHLPEPRDFDVIIVDGLDRPEACRRVRDRLKLHGALLLDNSNTYPEAMQDFRDAGWRRIDFYGHAPGVIMPHCTSLFFREDCFLFAGATDPFYSPLAADGPADEV